VGCEILALAVTASSTFLMAVYAGSLVALGTLAQIGIADERDVQAHPTPYVGQKESSESLASMSACFPTWYVHPVPDEVHDAATPQPITGLFLLTQTLLIAASNE
jgi:hypothetical protein